MPLTESRRDPTAAEHVVAFVKPWPTIDELAVVGGGGIEKGSVMSTLLAPPKMSSAHSPLHRTPVRSVQSPRTSPPGSEVTHDSPRNLSFTESKEEEHHNVHARSSPSLEDCLGLDSCVAIAEHACRCLFDEIAAADFSRATAPFATTATTAVERAVSRMSLTARIVHRAVDLYVQWHSDAQLDHVVRPFLQLPSCVIALIASVVAIKLQFAIGAPGYGLIAERAEAVCAPLTCLGDIVQMETIAMIEALMAHHCDCHRPTAANVLITSLKSQSDEAACEVLKSPLLYYHLILSAREVELSVATSPEKWARIVLNRVFRDQKKFM